MNTDNKPAHTNRLAQESSPYLLQHAHNPVDWYPWGEEALSRARNEQKPILVSIGYAACHWCHVMERESFENARVAAVMNEHFVCIKVDREERPDVDQVYMEALQAMGVPGGWPLNVFLNQEAKPFYGGTYFSPGNWAQLLKSIGEAYQGENRTELDASAEQFARVVQASELEKYRIPAATAGFAQDEFKQLVANLAQKFDRELGGMNRTPKFPMPSIWRFLLHTYQLSASQPLLAQINLTLREMAWGGLYDQVGGGFARYSVDEAWLVPHFEKMLYDNGQLVSLYAEAYQVTQDRLYRDVVYDTISFVERELTSLEGGFYSSLDADSEGEEGRFYVFTREELRDILEEEEPLAADYYSCTAVGNWEHSRNILHRRASDEDFAAAHALELDVVATLVRSWKQKLLAARNERVRPGLDDKILTGWNALMLQSLLDAYRAFAEPEFLALALWNAQFIQEKLRNGAGLYRNYKNGCASISGFLEDYALVIQAYCSLYEATFDESWLQEAAGLMEYVLMHFFDPEEEQFFYTDDTGEKLIARKKELFDNVIPASNSVMAHNLHRLGLHLEVSRYTDLATAMLRRVQNLVVQEPQHLTNWASLYAKKLKPTAELAIVGPGATHLRQELSRQYLPNTVLAGTTTTSTLPLLQGREARNGQTTIYVCYNHTCQQPVHTVTEALTQM
ncbi:thioredoxin domain-containing protein [Hymenobacter tibetensis]|uniref:Thioredoxin domain-containing protein n=1 Tax=Hymenobacter tibetensis TaxID=497967 RepID=A0ABY4CV01_9BACT|nr:thioredoxin domain-containing protein [Hymenobacter tibetensis]UOG73862.1 thioredoxin domain-containing protein [Hymenobacter tibetensis]